MIPIGPNAWLVHGEDHLLAPSLLEPPDAVFLDNLATLGAVGGQVSQIRPDLAGQRSDHVAFDGVIEQREKLVELLLRERVELVVVALGATNGQPKPNGSNGVDAVENFLKAFFANLCSRLAVLDAISQKPGGDPLVDRRGGQQVPSDLFDGELVKWLVAVKSLDHPLSPAPGVRPQRVALVAGRVGIARGVEPGKGPALAVVGRAKQLIYQTLVGFRALVREEALRLPGSRRQAGQIEVGAPEQGDSVSLW